jgi:hypothetical protein
MTLLASADGILDKRRLLLALRKIVPGNGSRILLT